jgi:fructokinase
VYTSVCPYHKDCFEGLAAGPGIERRWGIPGQKLPLDHPGWDLEAHYIACGLMSLAVTLSPKRIVVGGGVMQTPHLFPKVRLEFQQLLNGYVQHQAILTHIDDYIVPPALGQYSGVLGTLVLAENALKGMD